MTDASEREMQEKYDRQLRLWGGHGQQRISAAVLYVCGSDACATEFLKTMLLHGVKKVIIVDNAIVTEEDLMTNFFTVEESIGKPRAEVAAELLNELNPVADIQVVIADPNTLPGFDKLESNAVVLTTGNKTVDELKHISEMCRERGVKQLHFQTTGFFGALYFDGGAHTWLEGATATKYPNELRLLAPFDELKEFWDSFTLEELDDTQHSHVPYTAILHKARQAVMKETGKEKLTYQEKQKLVAAIEAMRRPKKDARPEEEPFLPAEWYFEAMDNIAFAYGSTFLPPGIQDTFAIFEAEVKDTENNDPFWRLVRGTYNFWKKHNELPHYGDCPDMECLPVWFKQQKQIYVDKSKRDWEEVMAEVGDGIDPEYLARFAKNVWKIGAHFYKPIEHQLNLRPPAECWYEHDRFYKVSCVQLLFIAARNFLKKNGRVPDNKPEDVKEILDDILAMGANADEAPKFAAEFCRYKNTILPSVVATLAAVLAEETTKLIICQANPSEGCIIYDGIHGFMDSRV